MWSPRQRVPNPCKCANRNCINRRAHVRVHDVDRFDIYDEDSDETHASVDYADSDQSTSCGTQRVVPNHFTTSYTNTALYTPEERANILPISPKRQKVCTCRYCNRSRSLKNIGIKKISFKDDIVTHVNTSTMTPRRELCDSIIGSSTSCCLSPFCNIPSTVYRTRSRSSKCKCKEEHPLIDGCTQCESVCSAMSSTEARSYQSAGSVMSRSSSKARIKSLYNEGISDHIVRRLACCPMGTFALGPRVMPGYTETATSYKPMIQFECDGCIPYSHNRESRYHSHCTNPNYIYPYKIQCDDEILTRPLVNCTTRIMELARARQPRIRLPRKVLTSAPDIDTHLTVICQNTYCPMK